MERRAADDPRPTVQPRPAATIVLVRSAPEGLEVLLTRRPDSMAFAAGLHVFPGGRVEAADGDPRLVARARGPVGDPGFHAAYRIAAIRETWEEVGLLLGAPAPAPAPDTGSPSGPGSGTLAARFDRDRDFADLVQRYDLELKTDELVEIARWTTPRAYPRRFEARFFVAEVPPGAILDPDPREVASYVWLTPRAALAAMADGTIAMWPPTSTTVQRLERATSFAAVRAGLERAPEAAIGTFRVADGLVVMTGPGAFGPEGRPGNTVLVGRRDVVVVDPGDPDEAFLDAIEAEVAAGGGRVVAIALTHVDPGHASGSPELRDRTGARIFVGPGGAASLSWDVTELGAGARVGDGDGVLIGVSTPGHRPDHLAFLTADGTLLAGDALTDRPTVLLPPEGDRALHRATLARIAALIEAGTVRRIVPGHGPAIMDHPVAALAAAEAAIPAGDNLTMDPITTEEPGR
jgi:glyoxylase-like metal-dependent hydrolase (beta-lactamase superfamily II)/8-oxo-dGTP pyrophosphatase MutT (NUDIX family)